MIVAIIAVVLATTGSAFAARALITGADIKDGSITRADLSGKTIKSLRGQRGPAGINGRDGFAGPEGPQGSTGPEGPRGPAGPAGPQGQKGTTGDTGARGPQGATGPQGPQGDLGPQGNPGTPGTPGQSLVFNAAVGPTDAGTPLAQASSGPSNPATDGVELSNGGVFLTAGVTYKVDVFVSFVDTANPGTEYGVGRLFLDTHPLDGSGPDPAGGNADVNTTLVTPDVPNDQSNAAQASGSFLVTPGDNGGGGEQLTLRGALRTDGATTTANVTGHIVVTRIG
jgi:hypothetical protein